MRKYLLPVAGLALLAASNGAFAANTATSNFTVSVTVNAYCSVTATAMNFGTFTGSIPANTLATSTASVTCANGVPYALSLAPAAGTGALTATMANGASNIPADLTVSTAGQTGNGVVQATTINGKITAAVVSPTVGTYTVSQAIYVLY